MINYIGVAWLSLPLSHSRLYAESVWKAKTSGHEQQQNASNLPWRLRFKGCGWMLEKKWDSNVSRINASTILNTTIIWIEKNRKTEQHIANRHPTETSNIILFIILLIYFTETAKVVESNAFGTATRITTSN